MRLNARQADMRDGLLGEGAEMAMRIQCAIGESFEAARMVPVHRVHISLSAQNADRWFTGKLAAAGARCVVTPTVNPGFCSRYFTAKGLNEEGQRRMRETEEAYRAIGARLTYSCTPYLSENVPSPGECCAFSETSATIYVNSVLGARTNRESAASAACAAITGYVPEYGMLLPENRLATVRVAVEADVVHIHDYAMLGLLGKKIGRGIPVFTGLPHPSAEALIALGASLNVSGSYDMFHIPGVTPEAPELADALGGREPERTVVITPEDIAGAMTYDTWPEGGRIDYVLLGCPHWTPEQLRHAAEALAGRTCLVPVWILTSRTAMEAAGEEAVRTLRAGGATVLPDTCVDEACCWQHLLAGKTGVTDSPKALYYMSTFGVRMAVADRDTCLEGALTGRIPPQKGGCHA